MKKGKYPFQSSELQRQSELIKKSLQLIGSANQLLFEMRDIVFTLNRAMGAGVQHLLPSPEICNRIQTEYNIIKSELVQEISCYNKKWNQETNERNDSFVTIQDAVTGINKELCQAEKELKSVWARWRESHHVEI